MRHLQEKICLIIPCYNEENRLNLSKFDHFHENVYFLFVNDGSTDGTQRYITHNLPSCSYSLNLDHNKGKAEAVRQGMLHVKTLPIFQEIKWVGYWDADLSTPLEELFHFFDYSTFFTNEIHGVIGSRIYKLGSQIERRFLRHILGRLFSTVIAVVLKIKTYDSQCGAKIFRVFLIDKIFREPFISKWIFDVEILFRVNDYQVVECPLFFWKDVKGSKIKIGRNLLRVIREINQIRKKYL